MIEILTGAAVRAVKSKLDNFSQLATQRKANDLQLHFFTLVPHFFGFCCTNFFRFFSAVTNKQKGLENHFKVHFWFSVLFKCPLVTKRDFLRS